MKPLVTIIIPTYNRSNLIGETLDSIRDQVYKDWECIIVDDGSNDGTKGIVENYMEKDKRFKYYNRPKERSKGANACRNFGFQVSKGDLINWFDSDDLMYPEKLEIQVADLMNSEYPFCVCQAEWFDSICNTSLGKRGPLTSDPQNSLDDYITKKIFWTTGATLWKRKFLEQNNLFFDESLHQSQEFYFNVKALSISPNYVAVTKPLFKLVKHESNVSSDIFENYSKTTSHIRVRSQILKNYCENIKYSTVEYLYSHIYKCFSICIKRRKITSSVYIFYHLAKSVNKIKRSKTVRIKFCLRMLIVLFSVPIFSRGQKLIRFF